MGDLWTRIETRAGEAVVKNAGVPVHTIVERLEAGDTPATLAAATPLAPSDLIAALAHDALSGDRPERPALVQNSPERPRLAAALTERAWAAIIPDASRPARLALAAGLLQIYDFWDGSHSAAQEADDLGEPSFSAYWHGIAHRREPDSSNAAYWFRRVGRHALFPAIADAARPLLEAHGDPAVTSRLIARGEWNPLAFIDLCTRASSPRSASSRFAFSASR